MRRLRPADVAAGVAGVALLVALFLPWYVPFGNGFVSYGPGEPRPHVTGWQAFSAVDVLLAKAAGVAIALVVVTVAARRPATAVALTAISTVTSAIAVLLVVWRLVDVPDFVYDRLYGAWLGLAATLLVFVASFAALRARRRLPPA